MTTTKQSSVGIIPCFNGENNIAQVVGEVSKFLDKVIVVDDGSTDSSAVAARKAGAQVYSHPKNLGVGAALMTGFKISEESGYKKVIILDADGAHNPANIPALLSTHEDKSSLLTIGSRFSVLEKSHIPSNKLAANFFATKLINDIVGLNLPDVSCGFRVIDTSLFKYFRTTDGFGFIYEMIFIAAQHGTIAHCPVDVRYDAQDVWFTKSKEALDMLQTCNLWSNNEILSQVINMVTGKIINMEIFFLYFPESTGNHPHKLIIGHPIHELRGYIFQSQHPDFIKYNENYIVVPNL